MKKQKVDADGNKQADFFSAPTLDVIQMQTIEKLRVRYNDVVRIIECGDADYARLIWQGDKWRKVADMKNYKWAWVDGERVSVIEAKGIVRFLETWTSRRAWFKQELISISRSIAFHEGKEE